MLLSLSATLTIVSILLSGFIFCRSEENIHPLLIPGKCKRHVWRTDPIASLPGICFFGNDIKDTPGLIRYGIDINTLKDIKIKTYKECRTLCCNLGDKCNTWQYQNSTGTCKIDKGFVRRGPEGADTAAYCDPFPPVSWNGKMLKSRDNGVCTWAYNIPAQCFAFGMEKLSNGTRINTAGCEEGCCRDHTCNSWQELPDRGCYWGKSDCKDTPVAAAFNGGRKCVPKFCGGWEDKILKKH